MASTSLPLEVWERIALQARRRELSNLALVSRTTYAAANVLLYQVLEFSFCKCSQTYLDLLERTFSASTQLSGLVKELNVDMRALCQVKDTSSDDKIKPAEKLNVRRVFAERLDAILGREEHRGTNIVEANINKQWNRMAVYALETSQIDRIFSSLLNITKVSIVLGHYSEGRYSFITHTFSRFFKSSLMVLKLHETPLFCHISGWYLSEHFERLTGLRCIDLGYMPIRNVDLNHLLSLCACSLEELRLHWIMQADSIPFFTDYEGPKLQRLKVLVSKGPQTFHDDHTIRALGSAPALEEVHALSLSVASAASWTLILDHLARAKGRNMFKVLKFGTMTSASGFWRAVAGLLYTCGDQMNVLHINGSPKGRPEPLSDELWSSIATGVLQDLSELVFMWRDEKALSLERAQTISSIMPSLKLLHINLRFPSALDSLTAIAQFPELIKLHLSFSEERHPAILLPSANVAELLNPASLYDDMARKGPQFRSFVETAGASCPHLREVSWSIYGDGGRDPGAPSAYVEINRCENQDPGASQFTFTDLNKLYREEEADSHFRYRICVGQKKKVLLNKKPGWREDMGHSFGTDHSICPYAKKSLPGVATQEVAKSRRAEL